MNTFTEFTVGTKPFTLDDLFTLSHRQTPCRVSLSQEAWQKIDDGRHVVDCIVLAGKPVYGVNTGFGALAEVPISRDALSKLQHHLLRSHAVGVGAPLSAEEVRALLLLRMLVLSTGTAGVRRDIVTQMQHFYHHDIMPVVPEKGSVGASGDLAPLAHLALGLVGEGEVFHNNKRIAASEALQACQLTPLTLAAKEGLALVNGTQAMSAVGGLALFMGLHLLRMAHVIGAMTVEGLMGSHRPFDARISALRAHPGQIQSASMLRYWLAGSQIAPAHAQCHKVQDAYSLRCMPQVHGASYDALNYARTVLEIEMNSATDNPLVLTESNELISGGNFHGQPLALAFDFAAMAIAELASISERRIEQMLNPHLSLLPAFLTAEPGCNSGFMMAQVTAASLVNENKILAHPASVDSIPGSASREDHVSMGMTSARKLREIVKNTRTVLAIELLCAAQALDFRYPLLPGPQLQAVHRQFRQQVPHLDDDRILAVDIEKADKFIQSFEFSADVPLIK